MNNEKEKNAATLKSIQNTSEFCKKLRQNKRLLSFIEKHLFLSNNIDLGQYIKKKAQENFIALKDVVNTETVQTSVIQKRKIKIYGLCWHDCSIFKFIDDLYAYTPGFVKILQLKINKSADFLEDKPVIEMEITCEYITAK